MSTSKHILIIEDDLDTREVLVHILEDDGYSTHSVGNGSDALDYLGGDNRRPDLILLDLRMPVMDGWDFHRELRQHPHLANIPVVALTGIPHATAKGIVTLTKPIHIRDLLDAVRRHCL